MTTKRKPDRPEMEYQPVGTMKDLLSRHNVKWSMDLADVMYPRTEEEKKDDPRNLANQRKVLNIAYGITKNSFARIAFLNSGKVLLEKYRNELDRAMAVAEEMKLAATA